MKIVATKPKSLTGAKYHCPGQPWHHSPSGGGVMDELNIREQTIGICPVGCSVLAYDYFNCDMAEAAHGRARLSPRL